MKKCFAILIVALITILSAINVFATELNDEIKDEVFTAAHESMRFYEAFTGYISYSEELPYFSSPIKTLELYNGVEDFGQEYIGELYTKTSFKMTSEDEYYQLIDKYFVDYSTNTVIVVERDDIVPDKSGRILYSDISDFELTNNNLPIALIYNGELYVMNQIRYAYTVAQYCNVLEGEIISYSGDTAVIQCDICDFSYALGDIDEYKEVLEKDLTVELKKTDDGWKVCGGTVFDAYVLDRSWFKDATPVTGDTSILYLAIAASALVTMSALVLRRKRRIAE